MRRHKLALRIPVRIPPIAQPRPRHEVEASQSTAVETRHKVWYTLPLDTDFWRQDVVADSDSDREDEQPRGVLKPREYDRNSHISTMTWMCVRVHVN